jgi:hypothetical protein
MKARVALLLGIFFTISVFAQGRVAFANTSTTLMITNSLALAPPGQFPNQIGPTTGINTYLVGLYIAPQGTSDPNAFTLVGTATNGTVPVNNGRFDGGIPFVIPGNNGETIAFQVRAWTFSAGPTFEQAISARFAYVGSSTIGQVTPATGLNPIPSPLFGTGPGQVGGFTLAPPMPEPSSAVLLLLGTLVGFGLWRGPFRRQ